MNNFTPQARKKYWKIRKAKYGPSGQRMPRVKKSTTTTRMPIANLPVLFEPQKGKAKPKAVRAVPVGSHDAMEVALAHKVMDWLLLKGGTKR